MSTSTRTDRRTRRATGQASVNLLPPEYGERARARRVTRLSAVAVVAWVGVLGGVYAWKVGEVDAARQERDVVQAEVQALQARVAELAPYRELAERLDARSALLASAMGTELSWSTILNDLAMTFPADASLLTMTATTEQPEPQEGSVDTGPAMANVTFTGYSVERYAPGVEGTLIDFADVRSFFNPYLSTAAQAEIGTTDVTNFDGSVRIDDDARTDRYTDGLPQGDTP